MCLGRSFVTQPSHNRNGRVGRVMGDSANWTVSMAGSQFCPMTWINQAVSVSKQPFLKTVVKTQMKCQSCILMIIMKDYHITVLEQGLEDLYWITGLWWHVYDKRLHDDLCGPHLMIWWQTSNDVKFDVLTSGDPNNEDYIMMVTLCWRI